MDSKESMLIIASKDGNLKVVQEALDAGADVNFRDEKGLTALIYARIGRWFDIIKLLKERGAKEIEVSKEKLELESYLEPIYIGGVVDETERLIIKLEFNFDDVKDFHEGLARFRVKNKWGFINTKGEIIAEPQFEEANDFHEGLAKVKNNGEYGYIDTTGRIVIEPQFEKANDFHEGLAKVKSKRKWGYIDRKGNMIIEPQFEKASDFHQGIAIVEVDGKSGYVDKTGKIWGLK